ncbi:hypothetical protein G6F68_013510 [Rhizopus microsporus]|nr:hypothetical protein G6F68_013510 [Rhizopus microsporus]
MGRPNRIQDEPMRRYRSAAVLALACGVGLVACTPEPPPMPTETAPAAPAPTSTAAAVQSAPATLRPRDRAAGKGHRRPTAGQLHRCRGRAGTAQGRKPPGTGRRRVAGDA